MTSKILNCVILSLGMMTMTEAEKFQLRFDIDTPEHLLQRLLNTHFELVKRKVIYFTMILVKVGCLVCGIVNVIRYVDYMDLTTPSTLYTWLWNVVPLPIAIIFFISYGKFLVGVAKVGAAKLRTPNALESLIHKVHVSKDVNEAPMVKDGPKTHVMKKAM